MRRVVDGIEVEVITGDIGSRELELSLESGRIAWDIETTGLDWNSDKICLCQLFIPKVGVKIIRATQTTPRKLVLLLEHPDITKVFHHAMFDLRFMAYHWKVNPSNIECTKIASKLLRKASNGKTTLKDLLREEMGVVITKDERISDWESTSLRSEQISYAARDVVYLLKLMSILKGHLVEEGLLEVAFACMRHIPTQVKLELLGYKDVFGY